MFIKKDLRKIPAIIADLSRTDDTVQSPPSIPGRRDVLDLSRRPSEFSGRISALSSRLPSLPTGDLRNLRLLNLYASGITNLEGIARLADALPGLEALHLGGNPVRDLPSEMRPLVFRHNLEDLWLEDCEIELLPECLSATEETSASSFIALRLTGNKLSGSLDDGPCPLGSLPTSLRTLALDRNNLGPTLSSGIAALINLEVLHLRQNDLTELPDCFAPLQSLTVLHLSSNRLVSLPDSITQCISLTELYVNGNRLTDLPVGMEGIEGLRKLYAQDNKIVALDESFAHRFGLPEGEVGACTKVNIIDIQL
mmetsp:Transcript_36810/g.85973  ORF Transcript_36810/g.85973 Transcript_36810/m.85973 type:complete len:311 (-) Transcript_36810:256-1188(-)